MNRMNPEIKQKWIKALRSGDYRQGRGKLSRANFVTGDYEYCCLGVLCEVLEIDYKGSDAYPAPEILTSVGLDSNLTNFDSTNEINTLVPILADMNDTGKDFMEIAAFIEENL